MLDNEAPVARRSKQIPLLAGAVLALLLLNLGLIAVRVLLYPPLLAQSDSTVYIAEPTVLLLIYAALTLALTWQADPNRQTALRVGTVVGLIAGLLWIVNLTIETFVDLSGPASILGTAPFLLGGFALWGVAGFLTARATGVLVPGITGAVWAAMMTVLLTVTFGFLLGIIALPRLEQFMGSNPDFLRSGWHDISAFAIANQFDSGFSHLLGAPIISLIVGTIGAGLGVMGKRAQPFRAAR